MTLKHSTKRLYKEVWLCKQKMTLKHSTKRPYQEVWLRKQKMTLKHFSAKSLPRIVALQTNKNWQTSSSCQLPNQGEIDIAKEKMTYINPSSYHNKQGEINFAGEILLLEPPILATVYPNYERT